MTSFCEHVQLDFDIVFAVKLYGADRGILGHAAKFDREWDPRFPTKNNLTETAEKNGHGQRKICTAYVLIDAAEFDREWYPRFPRMVSKVSYKSKL